MSDNKKITDKFNTLIIDLTNAIAPTGMLSGEYLHNINYAEYSRIRTEGLNLIKRIIGEDSDHYKDATLTKTSGDYTSPMTFLGILKAAQNDFEQGFLFDLRKLLEAEILDDFIEQSEVLLNAGYFHPAASLLGAVLEDALRKLSDKAGISYPEKTQLNSLNIELCRNNVYGLLIQKRITAIGDVRNNADHGKFDKFKKEDVEDMLKFIKRFTSDYLC